MPKTLRTTSKTSRNRSDHKRAAPGRSTTAQKTPVAPRAPPCPHPARVAQIPPAIIRSQFGSISAERKLDNLSGTVWPLGCVPRFSFFHRTGTVMGWGVKVSPRRLVAGACLFAAGAAALACVLVLRRMDRSRFGRTAVRGASLPDIWSWITLLAGGAGRWQMRQGGGTGVIFNGFHRHHRKAGPSFLMVAAVVGTRSALWTFPCRPGTQLRTAGRIC